jgi:hypothetical protein
MDRRSGCCLRILDRLQLGRKIRIEDTARWKIMDPLTLIGLRLAIIGLALLALSGLLKLTGLGTR